MDTNIMFWNGGRYTCDILTILGVNISVKQLLTISQVSMKDCGSQGMVAEQFLQRA